MLSFSKKHASGVGMKFVLHPWQILLLVLAGWINKHQQNAIEYLIVENRILFQATEERLFSKGFKKDSERMNILAKRPPCSNFPCLIPHGVYLAPVNPRS